ncbi:phosphate acetyltransferase [Candidatus Woesearchaeota archaeon]|nr:phosphate acetyltransferase [Candidatus Woesearchaeota archaeon]
MHPFFSELFTKARRVKATIVLAEAEDERVVKAAHRIERLGLAKLILIGRPAKIAALAKKSGSPIESMVINPRDYETNFASELYSLRKKKGMKKAQADKLALDKHYFGAFLVRKGIADGMVSGNLSPTADTLRAALHVVGTLNKSRAYSYFLMLPRKETKPVFFADCGLNIDPDEKLLATIGAGTAQEAKRYGIRPRVAFLSYSTKGSAGGASAEKSRKAAVLAKRKLRGVPVDGELQFDAAFVPAIGKHKAPNSPLKGQANVFVFPDLAAGNIAYKIAERVGGWHAIGPIVAGLRGPINDLSRGCSADDIVAAVAITALQSR